MSYCLYLVNFSFIGCVFCLGTMPIEHLGRDAVPTFIVGGGPGGDRPGSRDYSPVRGRHNDYSIVNVCHLYQRSGQGRSVINRSF